MHRQTRFTTQVLILAVVLGFVVSCGGGGGGGGNDTPTVYPPGSLDQTFGSYGKAITAIGNQDYGYGMAIQPDGKIIVVGASNNGTHNFAVVRYNTDGSLDTGFGTDGKVITAFAVGTTYAVAFAVAVQGDGKIVVAGTTYWSNNDFAVARYNSDGTLDTSFGSNGRVKTDITGDDSAYAVTIQTDGKIVVAGSALNSGDKNFAVVRYNANGSLDTSFNTIGKVTTAIGPGSGTDIATGVAVQSDGKIVLSGYSFNGTNDDFAVVRYNTNGSLDTGFGTSGIVTTSIGSSYDHANGMNIQSDGKIVVAGKSKMGTYYNASLVRYNTDGSLDTSFGTSGKVTTDITTSYELGVGDDSAEAVTIQADGKIVAAGYYTNGLKKNFALARYKTDGTLDTTFGTSGVVIQAMGDTNDIAKAVKIDSSGKIVVAGYSSNGTDNDFALARFNP